MALPFRVSALLVFSAATLALGLAVAQQAPPPVRPAAGPAPNPATVRAAAAEAGLVSLKTIPIPTPLTLNEYIRPGQEQLAAQLGKALFWDVQVGSDGNACATCHFHAGADSRAKNQINPGLKGNDKTFGGTLADAGRAGGLTAPAFGPNYTLQPGDFPLRVVADKDNPDYRNRVILRDSNDKISSQGVLKWHFDGLGMGMMDGGTPVADDVFNVAGMNVRRVEPRHTPSVINAVFNHEQFWDGRAQNVFNGVNPFGRLDREARVLVVENGAVVERQIQIDYASLASQAVGPVLSEDEMSYAARMFPDVGKKILGARPLAMQLVHPQDSLLGSLARAPQTGLKTETYADLVKAVFQPQWWDSGTTVTFPDGKRTIGGTPAGNATKYSLIEANFSLFFGLAIQMYESKLVSDQTPFDRFMEGDDAALDADQLRGLLVFINRGRPAQKEMAVFNGVRQGNCIACHVGTEFTAIAQSFINRGIALADLPADVVDGKLTTRLGALLLDRGYSNIGVRPTAEDIAHGDTVFGIPFSRQPLARLDLPANAFEILVEGQMEPPQLGIKGAFKTPGLRNVELTGPYFHNGGQATLGQVMDFYDRQGDFADVNVKDLDVSLTRVDLEEEDKVPLIKFMLALTDERVRNEQGPFDHPQLMVPNGHPGNQLKVTCGDALVPCEDTLELPAVGNAGRAASGLPPLATFLGLPALPPARPPVPPPPR